MKKLSIVLIAMLLLLMVAGCGSEKSTTPEVTTYDVNVKVLIGSEDGDGLGNVVLKDGDDKELATTDDSGLASIKEISGEVTITPEHSDYIFEPEKTTVTKETESITFIATQPVSSNADLKEITLNTGTLKPAFDPDVVNYEVELSTDVNEVPKVNATAVDNNATVKITQADETTKQATIKVTAEDGTTTKTYTVSFVLQENNTAPSVAPGMAVNSSGIFIPTTKPVSKQELDPKAFTVKVSDSELTVVSAAVDMMLDTNVILISVDGTFTVGDVVTVSYNPTGNKDVQFDDGTMLKSFKDLPIDTSQL